MARRFERRLKRGGLITLSLSSAHSEAPLGRAPDPEITETDIWLRRLSAAHDGLRIVHLTDIHHSLYTPLEDVQRVVHLANRLRPDVLALTGDYVTLSPACIRPVAHVLGRLCARLGVFAVLGNHDFRVDAEAVSAALRAERIRVLRNAHFGLRARGSTLWVAGVDDLWWGADDLARALEGVPPRDPKILLCHNPLGIHLASAQGVDFVLSGHTHGGQVRLPVVGSLRGRSRLGERFVEGWNRLNGTQIYVSRGIGKVLVPFRLNCPPEIAVLNLRKA